MGNGMVLASLARTAQTSALTDTESSHDPPPAAHQYSDRPQDPRGGLLLRRQDRLCAASDRRWHPLLSLNAQETLGHKTRLGELLLANDFAGLEQLFTAFFASIPTDWYRNNPIAQYEGYYASVFYAYFASLGLDLTPEESSNAGRLDLALRFNGQVYLFEFKVVELAPEGRALEQIKARGYAERHRASGEPIHLVGVELSRERRSVVGFEVETWGDGAL